jgi:flagellar hook-associated protein 3 FlgL
MAVTPVSLARVSFNQRMFNMRESLRMNQMGLYGTQNALITGYRFQQPSEDPLRASAAVTLERRLDTLGRVQANLQNVNSVLTEVESAAQEAVDLFNETRALAVQVISDGTTPDERQSLVTVVNSLIDQLVSVGNRKYLNTHLFSGHDDQPPFELTDSGVVYRGDGNRMLTIVDDDLSHDHFTVPGTEFFNAVSAEVQGVVDLNPALTPDTRIQDLGGTTGFGVDLGRIQVVSGGVETEIDLSHAATVGDVIDKLNAELPAGMTAALGTRGIRLTQPFAGPIIEVHDVGGGTAARDLGLLGSFGGVASVPADLNPRLTQTTRVADLKLGAGVDLNQSIVIRNGPKAVTVDLSQAETVEDVLNAINYADVGVWARISEDGTALNVVNRISGTDLTIEEHGGSTATALGIRSLHASTELANLNDHGGVRTVDGDDLRITTRSGANIDVDLDGSETLQDVIDRINAAAGGSVTASLATMGNGLLLTDHTAGGGTLAVSALNDSPAVRDLGLDAAASGGQLQARDVNPLRVDSVFTALLELREGMNSDDRITMEAAGRRAERVLTGLQTAQGQLAAQARMMADRSERVDSEALSSELLLSDVRDIDFTEAAIRFQQFQMALQANLRTAPQIMNLSLLDYLS